MAILAVSYEFGSAGEEIGHEVERQMGYEYIALGRILDEAKRKGKKWERYSREYGEGQPNIWERYDWSFMGFMALVQSIILDHALKDNVVIMLRGGIYLLRGIPHTLRIRVSAPVGKRIDQIREKESISREMAHLLVKQADREIAGVIYQLYGKKWEEPDAYEIRFDTSVQQMDEIVEMAKNLLHTKDSLKTEETISLLRMKALAARINAAIKTNPDFLIPTLDVVAQDDGILIRGVARSIHEHKAIEQTAKDMAGRIPVYCEIHYRGMSSGKPHRI